ASGLTAPDPQRSLTLFPRQLHAPSHFLRIQIKVATRARTSHPPLATFSRLGRRAHRARTGFASSRRPLEGPPAHPTPRETPLSGARSLGVGRVHGRSKRPRL